MTEARDNLLMPLLLIQQPPTYREGGSTSVYVWRHNDTIHGVERGHLILKLI